MHYRITLIFLFGIVLCSGDLPCNKIKEKYGYVCACNATYCDITSPPGQLLTGQFHFYYTSQDSPGFNHEIGHFRSQGFFPDGFKYEVNKTKTLQKIRGFGGSFTDSFGAVLNSLSEKAQENLLKSFFAEDGIEYSVCRIVLGSCDFSITNYTYLPNYDPTLSSFSLTEDDYMYKIPHIKKAIKISKKQLSFLGTAWNAPDWLKVGNTSGTNYLKSEFRQLWASYFVKTLDAFKHEGIEFWALTTGNEPMTLLMANAMPVVVMFPEEQRDWVINNLGPALEKANYSIDIVILDDMRMYANWWMDVIMRDKRAEKYVTGIGIHYYMDFIISPKSLDLLHEKYPNQEIMYTESSFNVVMNFLDPEDVHDGMTLATPKLGSWTRGTFYAENIIENLNHWTTTYIDWNLALNEEGGPNTVNYPCDASIIVNETNDEFYKQPMFYIMGHFSKFMQPDATIIEVNFVNITENLSQSTTEAQSPPRPTWLPPISNNVQYVGALNPNGSISIVFYNPKSSYAEIEVHDPDRGYASLILEPKSLSTILYW